MSPNTPPEKPRKSFLEMLQEQEGPLLARLEESSKSIFRSKTFWLQVVTVASVLSPQVRAFVALNPVEATAMIAALNTLLRFATSGRVTLLSSKEDEEGQNGGGSGWNLLIATMGLAASAGMLPGLLAC